MSDEKFTPGPWRVIPPPNGYDEDEFLAHIVMPDGLTVGQHTRPLIAHAYESGSVTPLLPAPGGSS